MRDRTIHHLTPASGLRAGLSAEAYRPASLAEQGFVHCAPARVVVAVANDYFADVVEPLIALAIDPARLTSETRWEAPAPLAGGGRDHLAGEPLFPHVYGPIDRAAITGAARLVRGDGRFAAMDAPRPLDDLLASLEAGDARG